MQAFLAADGRRPAPAARLRTERLLRTVLIIVNRGRAQIQNEISRSRNGLRFSGKKPRGRSDRPLGFLRRLSARLKKLPET
jgi:hypothetical protein